MVKGHDFVTHNNVSRDLVTTSQREIVNGLVHKVALEEGKHSIADELTDILMSQTLPIALRVGVLLFHKIKA